MSTSIKISIEDAQAKLTEIVHQLGVGDEIVIVEGRRPVARLLGPALSKRGPRQPGSAKGKLTVLVEDDAHLSDFRDYMP